MPRRTANILFVSVENSCRSLLAEACLRHLGQGSIQAFSCGIPYQTAAAPSPWALLALQTAGIPSDGLECKGWTGFFRSGAPKMDFVITLDAETAEHQPAWRGQPETALWAYQRLAASNAPRMENSVVAIHILMSLRRRIELLVSLLNRADQHSDLRHDIRDLAHH